MLESEDELCVFLRRTQERKHIDLMECRLDAITFADFKTIYYMPLY